MSIGTHRLRQCDLQAAADLGRFEVLADAEQLVRSFAGEQVADERLLLHPGLARRIEQVCLASFHCDPAATGGGEVFGREAHIAYAGRVQCILIDPPYNTGAKDFAYNDHYVGPQDRYRQSMWLEFLYRRLVVARDLLAEDGVILACINDENRAQLDLLMEQVFPGRRVGSFVWRTRTAGGGEAGGNMSVDHEHVLVFGSPNFWFSGIKKTEAAYRTDEVGKAFQSVSLTQSKTFRERPNGYYHLRDPATDIWYPCNPERVWAFAKTREGTRSGGPAMPDLIEQGQVIWPQGQRTEAYHNLDALLSAIDAGDVPTSGSGRPMLRRGLPKLEVLVGKRISWGTPRRRVTADMLRSQFQAVSSIMAGNDDDGRRAALRVGTNAEGTKELRQIFDDDRFSYPKPRSLFEGLVSQATGPGDIVLDFFAGSGTTAHAVLALSARGGTDCRFIMVSNTEATIDAPDRNICRDVCAERVRRALAGYGDVEGLSGDFAYLRARRIAWDDVLYDLDASAIWTLLQLRYGRALRPFDPAAAVQAAKPEPDDTDAPTLVYVPHVTDEAVTQLRQLATRGPVAAFAPAPGLLRDILAMPTVPVEKVPDRLLAEFPRTVAGI